MKSLVKKVNVNDIQMMSEANTPVIIGAGCGIICFGAGCGVVCGGIICVGL